MKHFMKISIIGVLVFGVLICLGLIYMSEFYRSSQSDDGNITWLTVDQMEELDSIYVSQGTVKKSENLESSLSKYSDETTFAVAISFASMIPDDYLDKIKFEDVTASEYLARSIELQDKDEEASKNALAKYYELKYSYYDEMLNSLDYKGEKVVKGDVCREYFFFYTYMTKEEIYQLTCDEDEALYVFAPGLLK